MNSTAEDLILFRTLPAYYRTLPTENGKKLAKLEEQGASREEMFDAMDGYHSLWQGMRLGNGDKGVVSVGTEVSMIKAVCPASEIVADLMQDFI